MSIRGDKRAVSPVRVMAALAAVCIVGSLLAASSVDARGTAKDPASWRPWHLTSASQLRLSAPPSALSATTKRELTELLKLQKVRSPKTLKTISRWNAQPAVIPWTDLLLDAFKSYRPRPPAAAYDLALFYTGLYDAMVAAYDSRDFYAASTRPAPSKLDRGLKPAMKVAAGSTYASPEAAIAGAAETLIPYLFLDAPASVYHKAATDAINSRLSAGLSYRSDLDRARGVGQAVAQLVIQQAKDDGRATNTAFPRPNPGGDVFWSPTPPGFEPPFGGPAGTWRPWLMKAGDQFLGSIPQPSPYGSAAFMQQLQAVVDQSKHETPEQVKIGYFWDDGPGTVTPPGHWVAIAEDLIKKFHPTNEQALRVLALQSAAEADAGVAAWYVKYYYWQLRPITAVWRLCDSGAKLCTEAEVRADPSRAPYRGKWYSHITTPAFPSYPSAHSTFSGAASTVLAYFFPNARQQVLGLARQAAMSRLYGLIHYPEDNSNGLMLGDLVGGLAVERAKSDGAQ